MDESNALCTRSSISSYRGGQMVCQYFFESNRNRNASPVTCNILTDYYY
jgi:hypothetical protein